MNRKTKTIMMTLAILITSLACMTTIPDTQQPAVGTAQATETHQTPPEQEIKSQAPATPEQTCAKVTAIKTLNLRATADGVVIGTLYHGEVVMVADNTLSGWWLIVIDSRAGFASADYLEIVPCSQRN